MDVRAHVRWVRAIPSAVVTPVGKEVLVCWYRILYDRVRSLHFHSYNSEFTALSTTVWVYLGYDGLVCMYVEEERSFDR